MPACLDLSLRHVWRFFFMVAASMKFKRPRGAPDLSEYRKRYPLTVANFGALARLVTRDEVQSAISNRYRSGFVKFYDAGSRVKAPPLWMDGVLDVAADANKLLTLAAAKLETSETGSALMSGLRFVRCYIQ